MGYYEQLQVGGPDGRKLSATIVRITGNCGSKLQWVNGSLIGHVTT